MVFINIFTVMRKILVGMGFPILFLLASCQHHPLNTASIQGHFSHAAGIKLVLQELDTREIHSVDSVLLDDSGKFNFNPVVNESGFWLIKAPSGKIMVLSLSAGDQVELSGSTLDFPDFVSMKGPEEAALLNDFFRRTRLNERKVDSLEILLAERQDSSDYYLLTQKLDSSFRDVWESQRKDEMVFIDSHPGSLASLVVLNYAFGMSPVLSPEEDFAYYQKLDSTLVRIFPGNKHVKFHHQRVENALKAAGGR
jgi:hypothetical protein